MATDSAKFQRIKFNAGEKNANALFDELENCDISDRSSDRDFLDAGRVMLGPRDGTEIPGGQAYDGPGYASDYIESSDGNDSYVATSEGKVYEFQGALLHNFGSASDPRFSLVNLPYDSNGITYTTPSAVTNPPPEGVGEAVEDDPNTPANEQLLSIVVRDPTDDGFSGFNNVGKFIFIKGPDTRTPIRGEEQVGLFGRIEYYDDTNLQYGIASLGNQIRMPAGIEYMLFLSIEEYVVASTGEHDEIYINKDSVVETLYTGLGTRGLRQASDKPTVYLTHNVSLYEGSYWTYVGNILIGSFGIYTSGTLENPFRFVRTSQRIIKGLGSLRQLFEFRNKLIIGGSEAIYYMDQRFSPYAITTHYGVLGESIVDVSSDAYFISTKREILSFNESYSGQIFTQNIGDIATNYLKSFGILSSKVSASADSEKIYFSDSNLGVTIVFHIKYKFWSLYTGYDTYRQIYSKFGISVICSEAGGDPSIRIFGGTGDEDGVGANVLFSQNISSKDIYLDDVYRVKEYPYIDIWFEDEDTSAYIFVSEQITSDTRTKDPITIAFNQISPSAVKKIHHPRLWRISADRGAVQSIKWKLSNETDILDPAGYFYLVEVSVPVSFEEGEDYIHVENVL